MEKYLMGFVLVLCLVLLTGCGNTKKVLECSKDFNQNDIAINQKMLTYFEGNEVVKLTIDMAFDMGDEYKEYITTYKDALESSYKEQYNKKGVVLEVTNDSDKVYAKIDFDLKNMSAEDKKSLNFEDVYGSYSATRKDLIDSGYTCK